MIPGLLLLIMRVINKAVVMTFDFEKHLIGEIDQDFTLNTHEENRVATSVLAQQAKKTIHIFSHKLNKLIYDNSDFLDAVTQLAVRSRHTKVQILIMDTQPIIKNGHRIVETSRRVSSKIQIRKVHEDFHDLAYGYIAVDETALLYRKMADRYEAKLNFHASRDARILVRKFNEVWRTSSPEPMLKHLHI